MAKIFSLVTLILLIVLFPPAVLALITQDAVPGDVRYPVKRKLEEGILLVASLNPTAKAWFSVTRSERRFREVKALLSKGLAVSKSLEELVIQTEIAAQEAGSINNQKDRVEIVEKLAGSISSYDLELSKHSLSASSTLQPGSAKLPRVTSSLPLSSVPASFSPATGVEKAPSAGSSARPASPVPTSNNDQQAELEETRRRLEEVKRKLEEEKKRLREALNQNQPPASSHTPFPVISSPASPSSTPQPSAPTSPSPSAHPILSSPSISPVPTPAASLSPQALKDQKHKDKDKDKDN